MKARSLFKKSMLLMIIPIILLSIVLSFVSKSIIENYFKEDSYKLLDRELSINDLKGIFPSRVDGILDNAEDIRGSAQLPKWSPALVPRKSVQSSYIIKVNDYEFKVVGEDDSVESFELNKILDNEIWPLKGEAIIDSETVFYAIVPVNIKNSKLPPLAEIYKIAYISETYSSDLSKVVVNIFIVGILVFICLIGLIMYYVFKHMTKRLNVLEKGAHDIGRGNFDVSLDIEPFDEIGRLSDSMNRMSKQLQLIQEDQADQFQMISHELKTPIMVMQGYMDALIHNQYPNGTKEASYDVLNKELYKLEKLTQDIIILNKLDYLSKNNIEMVDLSLNKIFDEAAKRMNIDHSIDIILEGEMKIVGDFDSWVRVVENLLSNNLRYAKSKIKINLNEEIRVTNDGPKIDDVLLKKIMKPFVKGHDGGSGLGFTIMNNILKLYHYNLEVKNDDLGVVYTIRSKKEL